MPNDSDAGEYEEEWEEQDGTGDDSDGHEELSVHPLPKPLTTKYPAKEEELTAAATAPARRVTSDTDTASDNSGDLNTSLRTVLQNGSIPQEIVMLHARRVICDAQRRSDDQIPPAAPSVAIENIGTRAAIEAKRRLREYSQLQEQKDEEAEMAEAASGLQRRQVRGMYKAFNQSIGVADVPPAQRYKDARRVIKMEKEKQATAVTEETASRWYRKIKRQSRNTTINAVDYGTRVLEEARCEHRTKLQKNVRRHREIEKKLKHLSLEAGKLIATNNGGAYERGSYLLKLAPSKEQRLRSTKQPEVVAAEL